MKSESVEEIIDRLTHNGQYANEVCLLLYLSEKYQSLYFLDYLNITGKELERLVDNCCDSSSIDYLTQTIRFLRSGFLSRDEIMSNINSPNPIYFITRLMNKNEDWDYVYEEYASDFRTAFRNNNKPKTK